MTRTRSVTWKDYVDTTAASLHGDLAAIKDYVNRVFDEHQKAVTLTQQQTATQVAELNTTTAQLEYVNAVFTEHRKAIEAALVQVDQRFLGLQKVFEVAHAGRREYVDRVFAEHQRAIETALVQVGATQSSQQRAVEVALVQVEQRIKAVQDLSQERVDSVRREAVAALAASEKAIVKSEAASERRFEAVNEFRAQLTDQTGTFMPREVAEALITELRRSSETQLGEVRNQLGMIQQRQDQAQGSVAGSTKSIGYMVTAVGILLTIIIFAANYFTAR